MLVDKYGYRVACCVGLGPHIAAVINVGTSHIMPCITWKPVTHPDLGLHNFEDARRSSLVKPLCISHFAGFGDDWREQVVQASALARKIATLHTVTSLFHCSSSTHDAALQIICWPRDR